MVVNYESESNSSSLMSLCHHFSPGGGASLGSIPHFEGNLGVASPW
jgi:hypothetical protein